MKSSPSPSPLATRPITAPSRFAGRSARLRASRLSSGPLVGSRPTIPRGSFVALDVQALDLLSLVVQPDTVEVGPVSPDDITSPRRAAGAAMGQA